MVKKCIADLWAARSQASKADCSFVGFGAATWEHEGVQISGTDIGQQLQKGLVSRPGQIYLASR